MLASIILSLILGLSSKNCFHFINFPKSSLKELLSWIEDEDDLVLWSGNTFEKAFSRPIFLNHLKRGNLNSFAFVNHKNELFAYGEIVQTKPKIATICRVIVHPEKRGLGIGQKFCQKLICWIQKKDEFNWISLNTLRNNLRAYHCYNNLGFHEVKVQPKARFLNGSWQDLIIMRKKI